MSARAILPRRTLSATLVLASLLSAAPAFAQVDAATVDASVAAESAANEPADASAHEAIPAPAPAEHVATSSASDVSAAEAVSEAELAAVLGDVPSDGPSFQIYGFADLNIGRPYIDKKNPSSKVAGQSAFAIGNVNVYLASNLTHGFSSLVEVRLTYMPAGNFDPSGKVQTTYAIDPSGYGRADRWGGIILQRVHLDYSYNGLLNVRVGQFLTPYGIWNVDHGSPTVISTFKPYPIGNAYIPERQTGLELFGSHPFKNATLGYHVTVSNGRGDVETTDFDKNKALGGRLFVATDVIGSLKVGVSAYGGRATKNVSVGIGASSTGSGLPPLKLTSTNQYDEFALAGDLLWEWKNLRVQGEVMMSQIRYTKAGRRLRTTDIGTPIGLVPDHIAFGWYGLIGYRLPWWSIMPFFLVDQFRHPAGAGPDLSFALGKEAIGYNFGLNIRPIAAVVLKGQFTLVQVPGDDYDHTMIVGGQAAWAF